MVDVADQGDRIETREDLGDDDAALFSFWQSQEAIAEKEEKNWTKQGRKIVERYRDERTESEANGLHRFNILWSNVQTLIPTLYGRTPKPDVERRFKDNDPTGRLASILLERSLSYTLDNFDFDAVMESVVEDRLLPGRGVARVLYIPHFGDEIEKPELTSDEGTDEQADEFETEDAAPVVLDSQGDEGPTDDSDEGGEPLRQVTWEETKLVYTFWEDYREGPARTWPEVPWVRFRSYLTRDELIKRFGKENGSEVELDYTPKGSPSQTEKDRPPADLFKKAQVHEIWDRSRNQVVWLAPGTPDLILDKRDDPLRLPDFFPNPDPLRSTTTTNKRTPVADYIEYQDQARELDRLTARIDRLVRALKVSGVYAGDEKQVLQQLVDEGTENRLIPVGDSQAWADKGGMKGIIEWMPIEQVAQTLIQLYNARDRVKALLYELTGIGDIMRGNTEPDETAAAQKLKANFSTRRVSPQQRKVAKFAKHAIRLMAAVISEHFSSKTISLMTGYPQLDPVPPLPPKPMAPMLPPVAPQPQLNGNGGAMAPIPNSPAPQPAQAPLAGKGLPPGLPAVSSGAAMNGGAAPQGTAPPNPAMQQYQQQMAQWTQLAQAQAQVIQANQKKQQEFDQAVQLIKQDGVHGFRIDIEADSTIAIDEAEDQENRAEFLRSFIPLMEQMVPIAMGNPAMANLAKDLTLFGVRGFREARSLEETIATAFDVLAKMPPPPAKGATGADSPADLALRGKQIQADDAKTQAQLTIAREKNAIEMAKLGQTSHDNAAELAQRDAEARASHGLEIAKSAEDAEFKRSRADALDARGASRLS
jgi:hypothetical protein